MSFWISITIAVVCMVTFGLINKKVMYADKLSIKVENPVLRVALFVLMAVIIGVFTGIVERIAYLLSDNELLAEIVKWLVLGALFPFLLYGITSKSGTNEQAQAEKT